MTPPPCLPLSPPSLLAVMSRVSSTGSPLLVKDAPSLPHFKREAARSFVIRLLNTLLAVEAEELWRRWQTFACPTVLPCHQLSSPGGRCRQSAFMLQPKMCQTNDGQLCLNVPAGGGWIAQIKTAALLPSLQREVRATFLHSDCNIFTFVNSRIKSCRVISNQMKT